MTEAAGKRQCQTKKKKAGETGNDKQCSDETEPQASVGSTFTRMFYV
jgi:hypothetical protein